MHNNTISGFKRSFSESGREDQTADCIVYFNVNCLWTGPAAKYTAQKSSDREKGNAGQQQEYKKIIKFLRPDYEPRKIEFPIIQIK
jgi:hypothetical protein